MADSYIVNEGNDRLNQYRNVIGVPSRRRIIFGAACIIFVLTLIVIAFAVMSRTDKSRSVRLPYASFHSAVNVSVDPCIDFYNFTCGFWTQNNSIREYEDRVTSFSLLQNIVNQKKQTVFENAVESAHFPRVVNNAIHFYNICSEPNDQSNSDTELLFRYFDLIGGWPILNYTEWDESSFDWQQSSASLIKHLDLHTVVGVYTIDSDKNGGRNVIYIKPSNLLHDEDFTSNDVIFLQIIYIILKTLDESSIHADILNDIESLKEAEVRWRTLLSSSQKVSYPQFMSVEELMHQIPEIDWLHYLQLITNDTLLEINETVSPNDTVAIDNFDSIKKAIGAITSDSFSKEELANLFGWFIVKDIWMLIPGALQNYASMNNEDSEGMKRAARSKCYELVVDLFRCSVDYLYVKNVSHEGIRDSMILTRYLKSALQDIIQKSSWLDEVNKNSFLHRSKNMKDIIGFPNYLNDKTEFDKIYNDFPLIGENTLEDYFQITQYYVKKRILRLKVSASHFNLVLPRSVSDVSAYYMINQNTMVYPISLHNPPFYYFKGPWYLNFGAIGSVIGHEMMHGFENFGTHGTDLSVTWYTVNQKHVTCFKDQYSVYDSSGLYKNNGTRTLRENVADTEGLRIAFKAYKKHVKDTGLDQKYLTLNNYTPDQMFFIAYGTVWCSKINPSITVGSHSLPEIRVNKAVSNAESFAEAFKCPKGSPMNPVKKCSVW